MIRMCQSHVLIRLGDVVHLSLLGKDIVVLGSLKAARDLLDKRSGSYSNRLTSVMVQLCVDVSVRGLCADRVLICNLALGTTGSPLSWTTGRDCASTVAPSTQ